MSLAPTVSPIVGLIASAESPSIGVRIPVYELPPPSSRRRREVYAGIVVECVAFAVALAIWAAVPSLFVVAVDVVIVASLTYGGVVMARWARARLVRAEVAERLLRLGSALAITVVEGALAAEVGDPTLSILFRSHEDDAVIGSDGLDVPPAGPTRRRLGLLPDDHGATVIVEVAVATPLSGVHVRTTLEAATLLLEQARLQAMLRQQLAHVRASRRRLVRAAMDERRALEGRLHDGAQSSLFSAMAELSRARARASDSMQLAAIESSSRSLEQAARELRLIVQGRIYPAALREAGLGAALDAATEDLPLALTVASTVVEVDEATEIAAYLTAVDLLSALGTAGATRASAAFDERNGSCVLQIRSDAPAFRVPEAAQDRVAALGGHLLVEADPAGVRIEAAVPCES